jgi:transcriptional regulator with XRE-family HTH domain
MSYLLRDITGPQWRAIREQHGITRQEACAAVGIRTSTLRDIERGKHHPGREVRELLAHHYGIVAARAA